MRCRVLASASSRERVASAKRPIYDTSFHATKSKSYYAPPFRGRLQEMHKHPFPAGKKGHRGSGSEFAQRRCRWKRDSRNHWQHSVEIERLDGLAPLLSRAASVAYVSSFGVCRDCRVYRHRCKWTNNCKRWPSVK